MPTPDKSVLLIAFHFPPFAASSGVHRTVALARHLPDFGWTPVVLTARPEAYGKVTRERNSPLPPSLPLYRTASLDIAKSLSIGGRYPRLLALPDRWNSWLCTAVPAALRLVRRHQIQLIWSTYPLATAHLIGWSINRLTGLPWVADFRDPMIEQIDNKWYPADRAVRKARMIVEQATARRAAICTFCTESAREMFVRRYAIGRPSETSAVIENGYDELAFELASAQPPATNRTGLQLVHSGTLYPGPDRDPSAFLTAVARLRDKQLLPKGLTITLRATGFDTYYQPVIDRLSLQQVVKLAPELDYVEAIRELMDADGLLLFQGRTSNPAIPAKTYEYLRAGKPILAMVDRDGETARLLQRVGVGVRAQLDCPESIEVCLAEFLYLVQQNASGISRLPLVVDVERFSRARQCAEFASLFDRLLR